jgi:CBS domain containing-hemolysin-like protein
MNGENLTAWILLIASMAMAIFVSFLCSLLESALLSLTPSQLADITAKNPRKGDLVGKLKDDIEKPLAVILICNTAAHTIGAAIAGAEFAKLFGAPWLGVFTLAFTLIMVQYTEILPKTVGVYYNCRIMAFFAGSLTVMAILMAPLIKLVHLINRPFEIKEDDSQPTAAAEIAALASLARREKEISSQQERILLATPKLSERRADEIMLPVENISFVSSDLTPAEALNAAPADFHTRYPVCEDGDRDKVLGYINFKELVAAFRAHPERTKLRDIVRPIAFVAPEVSAANLLERFAVQHVHMAIVRDAEGHTMGLITMEDIVEELIGDLDDEFDPLPKTFYSPSEGLWVIGGGVLTSMIASETPLAIPSTSLPLSDWFCTQIHRAPKVGDVIKFENAEFYVRKIRRGRVMEFNVRRTGI